MPSLKLTVLAGDGWGPHNLEVGAGEVVGLSGPSGSGKTRLLRAVADLDPHRGEVAFGPERQSEVAPAPWRRRVGLLPGDCLWWFDRVGEHFEGEEATAPGFLVDLGLPEAALDWEVSRLSAGERQRLGMARLLSRQPGALLLDEPTANLDPASAERVEDLVLRYARDRLAPVLWVGHDAGQLKRLAARRFHLDEGRLEELL